MFFAAGVIFSAVFRKAASINSVAPLLGRCLLLPIVLTLCLADAAFWCATGRQWEPKPRDFL